MAVRCCYILLSLFRVSAHTCHEAHGEANETSFLQFQATPHGLASLQTGQGGQGAGWQAETATDGSRHIVASTNTSKPGCNGYTLLHGCQWTVEWNCPDQPESHLAKGIAAADDSEAYECCCNEKKWQEAPGCTAEWHDVLETGPYLPCCAGLNPCPGQWWGPNIGAETICLKSCENPKSPGDVKLGSFNVWWANQKFDDLANKIDHSMDVDIVNVQEAVRGHMAGIMKALNDSSGHQWQSPSWDPDAYWCGLTAFRSDRWDMKWSRNIGFKQDHDTRGTCGTLLQKKTSAERLCVWGSHPIWRNENPWWARDAIMKAADSMKECSAMNATSVFMCDCNTRDPEIVRKQLEESTGQNWNTAYAYGYDMIFVEYKGEEGPGPYYGGASICGHCGRKGCQHGCSNPNWGFSDHPPVYVHLHLPHVPAGVNGSNNSALHLPHAPAGVHSSDDSEDSADSAAHAGSKYTEDEICALYNIEAGCDWTLIWGCHRQGKGSEGWASDDDSTSYHCCCDRGKWNVTTP